jgi:putative endonuclease
LPGRVRASNVPRIARPGFSPTIATVPPSARAVAARKRAARRWYVYLIQCRSGAIYTGIALNVAERYAQHAAGTGARYTLANPPLKLLAQFSFRGQAEASRVEAAIKRLRSSAKLALTDKTTAQLRKLLRQP